MEEKINIKFIDTTNQDVNSDSIIKGENYTIDDCILVRTTDVFPFDKIVQTPLNGNAYGFGKSTFLGDIIRKRIDNLYPNYAFDEQEAEKHSEELGKYEVCFETCRRTVHFTLNGLVGTTAYGNFDGKPFVIFDPLKYHLDNTLCCLRVEDVYFNDDLKLSNESSILISEAAFNTISNSVEYLEQLKKFRVYIFKGNQQAAVEEVLKDLGYDSFLISSNGYSNGINEGMAASNMWNFVNDFARQNNISLDKHFTSKINLEDSALREEKGYEIDKQHLIYILENSNISIELVNKIKTLLKEDISKNSLLYYLEPFLEQLVDQVGLDEIRKLTKEFNEFYISELNNNIKHK